MQKRLWLADGRPDNGCFHSRIRENQAPKQRNAKGTRLKGTQLRLNSDDPAVFTHTAAGPEAPFESSPSLLPLACAHTSLYALSTVSTSYLSLSSSLPLPSLLSLSLPDSRFKTDFLFCPFDFLILSSRFFFSSLSVRRRGTRSTGVCRTY